MKVASVVGVGSVALALCSAAVLYQRIGWRSGELGSDASFFVMSLNFTWTFLLGHYLSLWLGRRSGETDANKTIYSAAFFAVLSAIAIFGFGSHPIWNIDSPLPEIMATAVLGLSLGSATAGLRNLPSAGSSEPV